MPLTDYTRAQIIKHALEHYIEREGASEEDIKLEKKVLDEFKYKVGWMKERYRI